VPPAAPTPLIAIPASAAHVQRIELMRKYPPGILMPGKAGSSGSQWILPHRVPRERKGGASAIWIFANLSFTGMRAQAKGSTFWKVVSFIFGFPGTLLTLLVVT
jgi:hypothetical protein